MKKTSFVVQLLDVIAPCFAFLVLSARFMGFVYDYAVNIFIGDQWDFNEPTVFRPGSAWTIFRWQNGPHSQGLGGVLSSWIDPLFRWNSRDEAFVAAAIIIIACLLAFYLKIRMVGGLTFADILIPLFFFTPAQYETTLGVTNYAHGPIPLLLVVCLCLAWTIRSQVSKYALIVLINFLAIYTGFGLFLGFVTPVFIAAELWIARGEKVARARLIPMCALGFSILSVASFFLIDYTPNAAIDCFSPKLGNPLHYFLFVGFMFSNFAGVKATRQLVPAILLGTAMVICVTAVCVTLVLRILRKRQAATADIIPAILIAFTLLFSLGTAYGRICLGLGAAQGPRYATYMIPAFLGFYLLAAKTSGKRERLACTAGLLVIALMSSARTNPVDLAGMIDLRRQRTEWKRCYLSHHDIAQCDVLSSAHMYSVPARTHLQEKLDFLEAKHLNLFADSAGRQK